MSENKRVVEAYLAATDRSRAASLLADDVEWVEWGDGVPTQGVRHEGRSAFLENFGTDELTSEITRLTEEGNVVVAEGIVRVHRKEGPIITVRFCDIFELAQGKVKRLDSFGALLKAPA